MLATKSSNLRTSGEAGPKPEHTAQASYALDKTKKQKIGDTTYLVSSFLRQGKYPAFLDILGGLLKRELQIG
jgi:hypothetical protein